MEKKKKEHTSAQPPLHRVQQRLTQLVQFPPGRVVALQRRKTDS